LDKTLPRFAHRPTAPTVVVALRARRPHPFVADECDVAGLSPARKRDLVIGAVNMWANAKRLSKLEWGTACGSPLERHVHGAVWFTARSGSRRDLRDLIDARA